MKKVRLLLMIQAVIMMFIGLYIVGAEFSQKKGITGNPIAAPPTPSLPDENPIARAFSLFLFFGILLAVGAVIELIVLAVSSFG